MRFVSIKSAYPGMIPANNILDSKGNLLLQSGAPLNSSTIEKLSEFGISGIYIQDDLTANIKINEALPFLLRKRALLAISSIDVDGCIDSSREIVNELYASDITTIDMIDLHSGDNLTASHSVNVAVTSCIIGMSLGMKRRELELLVSAALLHDIGKFFVPQDIIEKPTRLTPSEYSVIKMHPLYAYERLSKDITIPSQIKVAILSHHENVDGSGYPNGISGKELSIFSKILHVADVYDALISRRPFKAPYSPSEACEYLMGGCGIMFDQHIVEQFIKYIAIYPKGSEVTLSNGSVGYVYDNTDIHNLRPIVLLQNGQLMDLSAPACLNISIVPNSPDNTKAILVSEKKRAVMTQKAEKAKVLAVDDLKTNLLLIKDILSEEFDLTLCTSGKKCLDYFSKGLKADIVLMDIDMPELNGIETAKLIQSMTGNSVPILFVTSLGDLKTVMSCRNIGAAGYILRPYNPTFMKTEISRILYEGFL